MTPFVRLWLTRLLAAVIVIGSGLNGYLPLAAHDGEVGIAHILGAESGDHHHHHDHGDHHHHHDDGSHASGSGLLALFCHHEAPCDEDPGTASHVHVSCCGPAAVSPGETALAEIAISATIGVERGSRFALGQIFYPLFKPPRLSA